MTGDIDVALTGIGARISARRKALGLTLQEVAERIGTPKSHVWELEQGRSVNPSVRMCWQLGRALGLTLSEIIGISEQTNPLSDATMRIAIQVDHAIRAAEVRAAIALADPARGVA
jgi:transcriptional regulator with XRE-family HTH domain